MPAIRALGIATPNGLIAVAAVTAALVGAMTVGTVLVDARRATTEAERETLNARLAGSVARLERRRHLARRRLAYVVHGALQGALHVAAIRLTGARRPDAVLVDAVRGEIAAAYARIDSRHEADDELRTPRVIAEIALLWPRDGAVRSELGPGVTEALRADPDADDAAAEVIREAANNALRHGRAVTLHVLLELAEPIAAAPLATLSVTVRDDGSGGPESGRTGLGTRLYDDLCRTWSLERATGGTTIRGSIDHAPTAGRSAAPDR
ncbi:MAG: hypothetical protein ACKOTZ_02160 [Chloroflexota bacterium]